jgi:hypothetical protein
MDSLGHVEELMLVLPVLIAHLLETAVAKIFIYFLASVLTQLLDKIAGLHI